MCDADLRHTREKKITNVPKTLSPTLSLYSCLCGKMGKHTFLRILPQESFDQRGVPKSCLSHIYKSLRVNSPLLCI